MNFCILNFIEKIIININLIYFLFLIYSISLNLCAVLLPRLFEKCMQLWLSDKSKIIAGSSNTVKLLLQDCISKMCENEETVKR